MKVWTSTGLALVCFAANSLLCREALATGSIDAASFTAVRLGSGAIVLSLLALGGRGGRGPSGSRNRARTRWGSASLFAYAVCFSFAYRALTAATGALVLFAAVQLTMLLGARLAGERPGPRQWAGTTIALTGVGYLLAPGLEAPPLAGSALMLVSGAAWGCYSLLGRRLGDGAAVLTLARDFRAALVPALLLGAAFARTDAVVVTREGVTLAAASGALASGIGYALWYVALPDLSRGAAAVVQLAVPVLAGACGVAFLAEPVTPRLIAASVVVLGGIALSLGLSAPSRTSRADTCASALESPPAGSPHAVPRREAPASTA